MRALFAAFYKDIKLIVRSAGILALLLPALLLPALALGTDDMGLAGLVEAFPIAVRDEDDTIMSRTLITQLRAVDLFSQVRVLEENESDADALSAGAVAVATIPKDFFYDVYAMDECPVLVTLNSRTPLQSALFRSVFISVMGMIRANHASALGAYTYAYGELTPELVRRMRAETGNRLVLDALGRQSVFAGAAQHADLPAALMRRLCACVLGVLALFFALASAKTLPEERKLGVTARLRSCGVPSGPFLASKLLSALALSLPAAALASVLSGGGAICTMLLYAALFITAFMLMCALSALCPSPSGTQRWGNILLLLSLALGGTLWPSRLLPGELRWLTRLTLPNLALLALEARAAGLSIWDTLPLLWPMPAIAIFSGAVIWLKSRFGISAAGRKTRISPKTAPERAADTPSPRPAGTFSRLVRLTFFRLRTLSGGWRGLGASVIAAALCGVCAASLYAPSAASLRIAVVDGDGTENSAFLVSALSRAGGVELVVSEGDARIKLLTGELEGVVTLGPGYGRALESGEELPLEYTPAPSAVTAMGARELIAGVVTSQLRRLQAPALAESLLGRDLTDGEISELYKSVDAAEATLPELYAISWSEGAGRADPFSPEPAGFACLAALFTLLTAGAGLSSRDARAASRRLLSLPHGGAVEIGSALGALTALGFLTEFSVLALSAAGSGSVPALSRDLPAAALSALLFAQIALLLALLGGEGRIDAAAGMSALFICLLGGCFMDLSALPAALRSVTALTPAGLALAAYGGDFIPLTVAVPVLLPPLIYLHFRKIILMFD